MSYRAPSAVLVVEDDPGVRDTTVMILEESGREVLEARTAHEALGVLKRRADEIGVVFTDVRMPGPLDGYALARVVDLSWPWIRVIVTSGDSWPDEDDLPGTAEFLPKPWRPREVISKVEKTRLS